MSAVTDEQVEPAEPEGEPEPQPADEPEAGDGDQLEPEGVLVGSSAPQMSEREMEQAFKKLDAEATRHRNRLGEIMGDDALALAVCPFCEPAMAGFYFPAHVADERAAATLAALGVTEQGELQHDPACETCDYCGGMGETLTGSKVDASRTRACPKCTAKGWTSAEERQTWASLEQTKAAAAAYSQPQPTTTTAAPIVPAADQWGRPPGHEFHRIAPHLLSEQERARDPYKGY